MHGDNSKTTIVSFFSGYGGLEKGISAALGGNTRVLAYVEREAFAVANLVAKMEQGLMDAAPVFTNVVKFPYREFRGLVDIACGGVPCQPHSHAGKREGGADERFLFNDFIAGMSEMRPGIIFIENVQGLLTSKMPDGTLCIRYVLNQLEDIGYCVEKSTGEPLLGIFSAAEVGAPHQRKRVFILAHLQQPGLQGHAGDVHGAGREPRGQAGPVAEGGVPVGENMVNADGGDGGEQSWPKFGPIQKGYGKMLWPARPGQPQYRWEPPRVVNSASRRINRRQKGVGEGKPTGSSEGIMAHPVQQRMQRGTSQPGGDDGGRQDGEAPLSGGGRQNRGADDGEIKSPLGRVLDGPANGLDLPGCASLSDTELAEIREWMIKGTNRTDELRMCGNGVVPATAEKAFQVLYVELHR